MFDETHTAPVATPAADPTPECVTVAMRRWRLTNVAPAGRNRWTARRYDHQRRRSDVVVHLHEHAPGAGELTGVLAACGPVVLKAAD